MSVEEAKVPGDQTCMHLIAVESPLPSSLIGNPDKLFFV